MKEKQVASLGTLPFQLKLSMSGQLLAMCLLLTPQTCALLSHTGAIYVVDPKGFCSVYLKEVFPSGKDTPSKTSVRFGKCIWEALPDQNEIFLTSYISQINC